MITRRSILLSALALPGLTGTALAAAPVSVDVSPLVEQGWGANAQLVARHLAAALSGRIPAAEGRVVVRVIGISMPTYSGSSSGEGRGGGSSVDQFESEVLVVGPRGAILRRVPVLSSSPASSGGPWYDPDSETRRLRHAIEVNAGWIARSL